MKIIDKIAIALFPHAFIDFDWARWPKGRYISSNIDPQAPLIELIKTPKKTALYLSGGRFRRKLYN